MHLWNVAGRLWILLGLIAGLTAGAAVIYKWTDADGVVHYSDQAVPGAEKIVTSSGSANGIGSTPASPAQSQMGRASDAAKRPAEAQIAIASPSQEQVFYGDDVVPVRLNVEPGLQPTQEVAWFLNGAPQTDLAPATLAFSLPAMSRGTYVISATVTDTSSGAAQTPESVTFYVRQPSELAPLNPLRKK